MSYSICLATTGAGLWTSHDAGRSWVLSHCDNPKYPYELCARSVAVASTRPGIIWTSIDSEHAEDVIARSDDRGETYRYTAVPAPGRQVWELAVDPHNPSTILAGTRPGGVFRSVDDGKSWQELPVGIAETCSIGSTRVTNIHFTDIPGEIWVSVEIDGLFHSIDGGDTWERLQLAGGEVLIGAGEIWKEERHIDIHDVAVGRSKDGVRTVFVATPIGFFASEDGGATWRCTRYPVEGEYDSSLFYTRSLAVNTADPSVVVAGVGFRPPDHGARGGIVRSEDGGLTWKPVSPILRSVVWKIGSHPVDPDIAVAVTLFGQVLTTQDGGQSWHQVEREFGEIRGVCISVG
ncbi:WD40/YVTN/BNR-like repeat-containing protein [Rhodococcus globerulus]|uniref:Sortilin N-terminal domain-containing protein n=1 Tax=Rhodococcus globerulus TaxID=33008 RepID=A0ABU4C4M3_RHOGO|nr:hypothetical protein [Rhodococcus globerulus]MDV6271350.1 hypothetical protein [Rhodococcus globerulus]